MILVPSFYPPPTFVRVPSSPEHRARLLSPFVLFPYSPSINVYSAAPLQCLVPPIVRPPSSVRRRATNPPAPADQCPLLVPRPSVPYAGLHPPPLTNTAGGTWLGCGCVWRGEGDGAPRSGLESVVSPAGITGQTAKSILIPADRKSLESLDSSGRLRPGKRAVVDARILSQVLRGVRLSVCPPHPPPPPFPVQPYVSLYSPS